MVVKYERDLEKAMRALPSLVDPNADVPDSLGHGHGHGHGHGSDHDHDDTGPDGKAVRAAKDRPPVPPYAASWRPGRSTNGTEVEKAARTVPAGQGSRSFAARAARKRPV